MSLRHGKKVWYIVCDLQDSTCRVDNGAESAVTLKDYVWVNPQNSTLDTPNMLANLKLAIAWHGPISIGIDASRKGFSFYSNGVYYDPECGMYRVWSLLENHPICSVVCIGWSLLENHPICNVLKWAFTWGWIVFYYKGYLLLPHNYLRGGFLWVIN